MRSKRFLAALVVIPLLTLAGCSAASGGSSSSSELSAAPGYSTEGAKGLTQDAPTSDSATQPDRSVITTGYMTVLVEQLDKSTDELLSILAKNSGRVEQRSESPATDYNSGTASFTIRVPSKNVDAAVEELKSLGETQTVSINESDVTLQYTDLNVRINALQAGLQRLTDLLASASNTDELITIENAITDRQMELDSLKSQQIQLSEQIAESTLTVELVTESSAVKSAPEDYLGGVSRGWDALLGFLLGFTVFLGVLTPWLIPVAVLAGAALLVRRKIRKRSPVVEPAASQDDSSSVNSDSPQDS